MVGMLAAIRLNTFCSLQFRLDLENEFLEHEHSEYVGEPRTNFAQKTPPALGMYNGGRFLVTCCTGVTRE